MSAALAIAATTEVLRFIVENALTEVQRVYQFSPPTVSTGAPPRPPASGPDQAVVNLFLHAVAPNPAFRSHPGPARDAAGTRLHAAPLVLNLQYLLSSHGGEAIREIGFGTALHALHQVAIVPRPVMRDAFTALANSNDAVKKALALNERLSDQIESLTVSMLTTDVDALTKIWTAVQAPMRPSACFLVTAVFLEDTRPQRAPLPALSVAIGSAAVRPLSIASVQGLRNGKPWPVTVEARLVVTGEGLGENGLTASLGEVVLSPVASESGPGRLVLGFAPADVAKLRAGPQVLTLALAAELAPGRHRTVQEVSRNVLLRPAPGTIAVGPLSGATGYTGTVSVDVQPPADRTQRATLRLTALAAGGRPVAVDWKPPANPAGPFTTLAFKLDKVPRGTYRLQLEVDGVASQPMPDNAGAFQPQVTL